MKYKLGCCWSSGTEERYIDCPSPTFSDASTNMSSLSNLSFSKDTEDRLLTLKLTEKALRYHTQYHDFFPMGFSDIETLKYV